MSNPVVPSDIEGEGLDSVTIAKLVPVGRDTEDAFNQVVDYGNLSQYHRNFIHARPVLHSSDSPTASASADAGYESDRPARPTHHAPPEKLWAGHYLLSFDHLGNIKPTIG